VSKKIFSKSLLFLFASLIAITLTSAAAYAMKSFMGLPSLEELENPNPELASLVYSEDGVLLHKFFLKNRTFIPLKSIPRSTRYALIATEDVAFYSHWGVDLRRLAIAMGENIFRGPSRWQGASTITQQLAKNLYLSQERTVTRKVKEFITAIELEKTYTKDEILALYLNTVYFGSGAYGIEAAAYTYRLQSCKKSLRCNRKKEPYSFTDGKGQFHNPETGRRREKNSFGVEIYSSQPFRSCSLFY
jgi:penicillin-binding protein 1A